MVIVLWERMFLSILRLYARILKQKRICDDVTYRALYRHVSYWMDCNQYNSWNIGYLSLRIYNYGNMAEYN